MSLRASTAQGRAWQEAGPARQIDSGLVGDRTQERCRRASRRRYSARPRERVVGHGAWMFGQDAAEALIDGCVARD
jgi:hypothetical protein